MTVAAVTAPARSDSHIMAWTLCIAMLARLATLGLYPLSDTTESRYAEIARKMVELGDWITPWYDYGVPFWGKPPLSTWLTAASMQIFGVNEWAARLPHFLAGVFIGWLMWDWLRQRSAREAMLALVLLWGSALYFVAAGAVMTDMALLIGMMLAMRGFWLGLHATGAQRQIEGWLLFVGLALGLLAKGPIALILAGLPMMAWALITGNVRATCHGLPWLRGVVLMLLVALPWYALAERHTPGFLNYFLIGEHWHRFTVSGWAGDRYGSAHAVSRGTIWLYLLLACAPWSVLLPLAFGRRMRAGTPPSAGERSWSRYLLLWALTPCVFFTVSRNILWTYVLPSLPALAMMGAAWLARDPRQRRTDWVVSLGVLLTCGLFAGFIGFQDVIGGYKSAKAVVKAAEARHAFDEQLVFIGRHQFSASFYTRGQAQQLERIEDLSQRLSPWRAGGPHHTPRFVALHDKQWQELPHETREKLQLEGRFGHYDLYSVHQ